MIEIRPFDPGSATPVEWAAVHLFRRARSDEDAADDPVLDDSEFERLARWSWPLYDSRRWYAWAGDEIAGVIGASFRRDGTEDFDSYARHLYAWAGVRVHWRRRKVATALLHPLLSLMRERNKSIATFETTVPAGQAFLAAIGAVLKHRSVESRAPFGNMDWTMLARWRDAAIADDALHWEMHVGRVPHDRIGQLVPQLSALAADMPSGDLDNPPIRYEEPAWLSWYEELDRHGGDHMLVMLMDRDAIAAVCEAAWDARFPDRITQMITAVARPRRGRGLGKAVKAAMMQVIREHRPDIRLIATSNADVNAPMLSINRRLGFAEHRQADVYQIDPEAMSAYLGRHPSGVSSPSAAPRR